MKFKWQQAPVKTQWGDDMVAASAATDKDHTVDLYCEREQTPKVEAMFALAEQPAQQEEPVDESHRDAQEAPFEAWWETQGQYLRAGGGQYEKTFAWHAWCAAAPQPAQQEPVATLKDEVIGCFNAAFVDGLREALAETQDEHLKDLVERRLMYALYAAQEIEGKK